MVLVGAAVLAVVSTVVAFHGWPGAVSAEVAPPRAMLAEAQSARTTTTAEARAARVVVPDAPAPRRRTVAAAQRRDPGAGERGTARVRAVAPADGPVFNAPTTTTGASVTERPSRPAQEAPAAPVRKLGADVGASTEQTVSDLGASVDPVSPTLGKAVDDVGQVVGDTVEGVTNTAADLLDGLIVRRP